MEHEAKSSEHNIQEKLMSFFVLIKKISVLHLLKKYLIDFFLWGLLFFLLILRNMGNDHISQYTNISLRYLTPISGEQAYASRQYAIEHAEENIYWPTFWYESSKEVGNEYASVRATTIYVNGEENAVLPVQYLIGNGLSVVDDIGCTISNTLAYRLFGDIEVVGCTIEIDEEYRTIRGVFEENELLVLLSVRDENTSGMYSAVELTGGKNNPARSDIESYLTSSGLGKADIILLGTPLVILNLVGALPVPILVIYAFVWLLRMLKHFPQIIKALVVFALLLIIALLLPLVLAKLPSWIVPTRWSDFTFWGYMFKEQRNNLREYSRTIPTLKDSIYTGLVIKQVVVVSFAICCSGYICFRATANRIKRTGSNSNQIPLQLF